MIWRHVTSAYASTLGFSGFKRLRASDQKVGGLTIRRNVKFPLREVSRKRGRKGGRNPGRSAAEVIILRQRCNVNFPPYKLQPNIFIRSTKTHNGKPPEKASETRSHSTSYRSLQPPPPLPPHTPLIPPAPRIPGADKNSNLLQAQSRVREASRAGAHLIILPECFNSPYGTPYFPKYAETLLPSPPSATQSPTFHALSSIAKETSTYLLGGSIPEYSPLTKKYHNTSLLFSPQGELLATHRKVHLFDIDIPGKITFRESEVLSPGNKVTIVDLPPYGKIAIGICYDIRFPELATIAARRDAFLLLYPGAFNLTTGALHWSLQARARAMDNQVYVALCSPARDMKASYNAWGHSMVVDPNAQVLVEAGEAEEIVYADLDPRRIEEVRRGIPLVGQRRFDVYPDVSKGEVRLEE